MGYRVEYDFGLREKQEARSGVRQAMLAALFFLCFLILVQTFWPEGAALLRGILIPGDPDVTVMALDTFALELSQGSDLKSAFDRFCVSIIEGAGFGSG